DLTRADSSRGTLSAFLRRYGKIRPVDHFVGVAPDGSGGYRILYSASVRGAEVDMQNVARVSDGAALTRLPLHLGGFLGEMIADGQPKLAMELDLRDDPQLGREVGHLPTCMVVPIFEGDGVEE